MTKFLILFRNIIFNVGYTFVSINYCAIESSDIYVTAQFEILKIASTDQTTATVFAGTGTSEFF